MTSKNRKITIQPPNFSEHIEVNLVTKFADKAAQRIVYERELWVKACLIEFDIEESEAALHLHVTKDSAGREVLYYNGVEIGAFDISFKDSKIEGTWYTGTNINKKMKAEENVDMFSRKERERLTQENKELRETLEVLKLSIDVKTVENHDNAARANGFKSENTDLKRRIYTLEDLLDKRTLERDQARQNAAHQEAKVAQLDAQIDKIIKEWAASATEKDKMAGREMRQHQALRNVIYQLGGYKGE